MLRPAVLFTLHTAPHCCKICLVIYTNTQYRTAPAAILKGFLLQEYIKWPLPAATPPTEHRDAGCGHRSTAILCIAIKLPNIMVAGYVVSLVRKVSPCGEGRGNFISEISGRIISTNYSRPCRRQKPRICTAGC